MCNMRGSKMHIRHVLMSQNASASVEAFCFIERMDGKQHGGTRMTLRAMRERAGLSQQDLRARVGINSVSYFWALEAWDCTPRPKRARDPHTMRLDTAKKVSEALGVSLDELWDGLD